MKSFTAIVLFAALLACLVSAQEIEFSLVELSSSPSLGKRSTCSVIGATCAESCGAGYVECSSTSCYNPSAGDSCCSDGGYCTVGTSCSGTGYCITNPIPKTNDGEHHVPASFGAIVLGALGWAMVW